MSSKSSSTNQPGIFRLFWEISKPYAWRRNIAFLVAAINFAVSMFIIPLLIASFLDAVQTGNLDGDHMVTLLVAYGVAQLFAEVVGTRLTIFLMWTFETAMQRDLSVKIFNKLANQTMFFHANKFGGSLVSQSNKLTGATERFWDTIIWSVLPVVMSVVGAVSILWFIYRPYAIFLGVLSVAFAFAVYFGSKHMARLNKEEAAASNKVSGRLADMASNVLAVKSSSAESRELTGYSEAVNTWRGKSLNLMKNFLGASTVYSSITSSVKIGALVFAFFAAKQDVVSIASIYLIVSYTSTVAQNLWSMNGIMRVYNRVIGDAHEMTEILNSETTVTDKTDKSISISSGHLHVKDITFTHDEGAGDVMFQNFSLEIQPGEKVGLVGTSGSGKSTLTKLILRFADIDSGRITIDGQDIAGHTQTSLRESIAYVPQEPLLFHRSILENISYTRPDASREDIIAAAKKAGAHGFIEKLKDGYDTLVGERGVKLSGGQRQRIAIARAILKDAPMLILDEATSALDSESEKLIQKSLDTLMQNRTSIVIAHRLSTIAKLDRILVMDNGQIAEDGTHAELLKQNGTYAKLWSHQSGGFIEE